MRRGLVFLSVAALAALAGCGRKALPLPPILQVPETTTDMWAYQDGREVVLTWSYPTLTRAGQRLTDLARVEVWRLEVPPGQEQSASGPQGEELKHRLLVSRGKVIARLEGASLEAATRGASLTYRDPLPEAAAGSSPPTFWYAVRSRRKDGTASALSNIVTWQVQPVPPTPTGFSAAPQADGIALSWDEVPGYTYVVERRPSPEAAWAAVSKIGIETTSFLDTTAVQGQTWYYRVRSLLKRTASPPSPELTVPYPDVYPPPAVTGLICLPEPGLVRLRWDASPESDVTYKVFRRVGDGGWEHLEESYSTTEYTDAHPPLGEVEYAVKAVDRAGNQSEAAYCRARTGT
jgi:predicted small lipoprotein YifL